MKSVCAWCNQPLDNSIQISEQEITHGICSSCNSNIIFQMGAPVQEFIDTLSNPVCIIDREGIILAANKAAAKILGKHPSDIFNTSRGEVFECAYSRLPEGCGHTVHCSGCTIRRTVSDTHNTGKSSYRVPAKLTQGSLENKKDIPLRISTERLGDVVYLRIDSLAP